MRADIFDVWGYNTTTGQTMQTVRSVHINDDLGHNPPLNNCILTVDADLLGYSEGDVIRLQRSAVLKVSNGTLSRVSLGQEQSQSDNALSSVNSDIDVDGNSIRFRATGTSQRTIFWQCYLKVKLLEPDSL